jgi:hypothetical protein
MAPVWAGKQSHFWSGESSFFVEERVMAFWELGWDYAMSA